jgi:hypothetical protein
MFARRKRALSALASGIVVLTMPLCACGGGGSQPTGEDPSRTPTPPTAANTRTEPPPRDPQPRVILGSPKFAFRGFSEVRIFAFACASIVTLMPSPLA